MRQTEGRIHPAMQRWVDSLPDGRDQERCKRCGGRRLEPGLAATYLPSNRKVDACPRCNGTGTEPDREGEEGRA